MIAANGHLQQSFLRMKIAFSTLNKKFFTVAIVQS
jgi:hypothetical protein